MKKITTTQLKKAITGKPFNEAVKIVEEKFNGRRDKTGIDQVCGRFYVDGDVFYCVMFFADFDGKAKEPGFNFNI